MLMRWHDRSNRFDPGANDGLRMMREECAHEFVEVVYGSGRHGVDNNAADAATMNQSRISVQVSTQSVRTQTRTQFQSRSTEHTHNIYFTTSEATGRSSSSHSEWDAYLGGFGGANVDTRSRGRMDNFAIITDYGREMVAQRLHTKNCTHVHVGRI